MSEEEKKAIEYWKRDIKLYHYNTQLASEHYAQIILNLIENQQKEISELKAKYYKDTHTLQNQLDIANADRIEKDKIIDLMANFMNKRSWKEHQVKDNICYCCKIEYSSEECVRCIKQYFKEKASEE